VLSVVASLLVIQTVSSSGICLSELPANIRPGLVQREMTRLLERSETFREQCVRIASAPYVRVVFGVSREVPDGSRGQTTIERFEAGAMVAWVTLGFAEDYVELIPHELEHVIEQIDRVPLPQEAAARRGWRTRSGSYETIRALAAGVRARQEYDGLVVETIQVDGRKPPRPRHPFD